MVLGNNVLAHVPDLNDFVAGLAALIKPDGVLTLEFPHLLRLIEDCQFDTIYDEHFSYFSFTTVCAVFHHHGLDVFDVEELPIHGGSLRVFANRPNRRPVSERVGALIAAERPAGIGILERYLGFQDRADAVRDAFCAFVADEKAKGRRLAAFGAAAKGNTFLNFCGVGADVLDYVVDDTPAKQGKYLPGSRVPVVTRKRIGDTRPDAIVILPWNFKAEIIRSLSYTREWGCRLVTCIPESRLSENPFAEQEAEDEQNTVGQNRHDPLQHRHSHGNTLADQRAEDNQQHRLADAQAARRAGHHETENPRQREAADHRGQQSPAGIDQPAH